MATISETARASASGSSGGSLNYGGASSGDALEWLPDTTFDELSDAVDAFEPLAPLELVLGNWETVATAPVIPVETKLELLAPAPSTSVTTMATTTPASTPPVRPRPPMKNPSRERLRAELRFLRQRVVEMESELAAARERQHALLTRKRPAVAWDHVAQLELKKRRRTEDENRKLCNALAKQTQVAKGLERVLHDEHGAEAFARFCGELAPAASDLDTVVSTVRFTESPQLQDALFTRLELEVARAYADVDRVLGEYKMDDARVLHTAMQTDVKTVVADDRTRTPSLLLELLDSQLVPFGFARTCDAIWRALSTATVYNGHDVDLLSVSESTIRFKSRLPWHANGEQCKMRYIFAMRRYMTRNRMVLVSRGAAATEADPSLTVGWEETGWIVVREMEPAQPRDQVDDDGGNDTSELYAPGERPCVLQAITRHTPHWQRQPSPAVPDLAASEHEIGAFSTMVLAATENDITHITGAMQTLLLDEVLDDVRAAAAVEP